MNYTTKNNLTQKYYFARMVVIFNLISFISFQLILAPCIYAEDISNATDIFKGSNISPLIVATNDNQHIKELQDLEQKEKEIRNRENQILKYKGMVATGKTTKLAAWGVGLIGIGIAYKKKADLDDKYQKNPEEDKDYSSSNLTFIGSIIAGIVTHWIGRSMVKKGEKGLEDLAVSFKHNGLENEYYVSYQYNF